MKYLKTYENKLLEQYSGMVYLNIPSEIYFKSNIRFQLIFIDFIYYGYKNGIYSQSETYQIIADAFQLSEFTKGDVYAIIDWDQTYNENDFKRIKFMTIKEFYNKYTDSFINIMNILIDELNKKNITEFYIHRINAMLDKLTIPESEHIINANKFNI